MNEKLLYLLLVLLLASCESKVDMPEQSGKLVSKIIITRSDREFIREIKDQKQIDNIISFVNQHRKGFSPPFSGVPQPTIHVFFTNGNAGTGEYGLRKSELNFNYFSQIYHKAASEEEIKEFLYLIGVPYEEYLKYDSER